MNFVKEGQYRSLLVITTSGGGGHLQAANAKILDEQLKNPAVKITKHDVLANAGGKWFGYFMINYIWDKTQRRGGVRALELFASAVPIFDIFFWIPVFFQILYKLFKYDIDHVVDTQPLCLPSITTAVRAYAFCKKKHLFIEKILTELPTGYATHYLKPIKRLGPKNRRLVHLITTKPLLADNQTAENFWQTYCGLSAHVVSYQDFPIRPHFKKYQKKQKTNEPLTLLIKLKTPHEKLLLTEILGKGTTKFSFQDHSLVLTIQPNNKVTTLMLGSQSVQEASLHYVRNFIDVIKEDHSRSTHHFFFVFCSHKQVDEIPLQEQIHRLIMDTTSYPSNLTIIPMSSQGDDVIAPLYFRSDATLTKAGGVTAMELMAVAKGKIWIHHEEKMSPLEKFFVNHALFAINSYKGMPKWEYGNATYLEEMKGAQMITPETFSKASRSYLCS